MSITIKGRTIMKGNVQAEAIVARSPLSFTYIDPSTGAVADKTHGLYGQTIKGKILVLPMLKGSAMQPFSLQQLVRTGIAPRGLIALDADTRLIAAAIYCEIPLMDKLERNPIEAISTGNLVRVNADKGVVEVEN
jgi:hypothetical protein